MFKIKGKNSISQNNNNKKNMGKIVQDLLDIQEINENTIKTSNDNKYYIKIAPKNIDILTDESLDFLIMKFKTICNSTDSLELLVVDKVERLEDNREFISDLLNQANNDTYRKILEQDLENFKSLESNEGSSREFYLIVSYKKYDRQYFLNIEQSIVNSGFEILSCSKKDIKNMLQIYIERNFNVEIVKDFDI